jgi:proteic killer suppression protein
MIISFRDQITEDVFDGKDDKKTQKRLPSHLHKISRRKLDMIQAAFTLEDLKTPPNNRLEKLKGERKHQHSIRINDQYRILFTWIEGNAEDVEIVDYH